MSKKEKKIGRFSLTIHRCTRVKNSGDGVLHVFFPQNSSQGVLDVDKHFKRDVLFFILLYFLQFKKVFLLFFAFKYLSLLHHYTLFVCLFRPSKKLQFIFIKNITHLMVYIKTTKNIKKMFPEGAYFRPLPFILPPL